LPNLVEYLDVSTYKSTETLIMVVRAATPGKLRKLGFRLESDAMEEYETVLNLCASSLRTLRLGANGGRSAIRLLNSIQIGFAQLRFLSLDSNEPMDKNLVLPPLPNLEVLNVPNHCLGTIKTKRYYFELSALVNYDSQRSCIQNSDLLT
jgi:hypothetical protein